MLRAEVEPPYFPVQRLGHHTGPEAHIAVDQLDIIVEKGDGAGQVAQAGRQQLVSLLGCHVHRLQKVL